jgi:hypothetical protein
MQSYFLLVSTMSFECMLSDEIGHVQGAMAVDLNAHYQYSHSALRNLALSKYFCQNILM